MGRVSAPFGIQGWVKLKAFTESADGLADFPRWLLKLPEGWREHVIEEFAVRSASTVAKFEGVDDRDAAEKLRGCEVAVLRETLGEADKGSIYWIDLLDLEVVNLRGEALGKVAELFQTGETSVLVVKGERERMIPFVDQYVKSVDREARRITVDWEAAYDV
ncbi:ribosome maturation factor RimM [Usitatibacter palustris]|uniref:Ribosome maturation factor RimM n=1 Tax=Usitatibacter palustris TaxID=2732487 RepID=A0A6M4HAP8_9PROT|nr:ribosome maturation factor RimM [Usitatibacter palustris]QJR16631.1 Ribosome maturation factor RimM [Usitatibacter palustris]